MIRACKLALTAGGLIGKAALGFLGFMVVIVAITPTRGPDDRVRSEVGDPTSPANRFTLTVPEGEQAGTLIVVDASGCELATLTHWYNGETAVVTNRSDGADVSFCLYSEGSAALELTGTALRTTIKMGRDGTTKTSVKPLRQAVPDGIGSARKGP